jgi:hypothetical protein
VAFEEVKNDYLEYLSDEENYQWSTVANLYHLITKSIPKFKNFGLSLRLNNFNLFLKCFEEIFLEFLCTNSPNYHKGMLLQLILFKYLEKKESTHPLMEFLKKEFSSLIEESNETQLSLLSIEKDNILSNHKTMEEKYLFLPKYYSISCHFPQKKKYQFLSFQEKIKQCFKDILNDIQNYNFVRIKMKKSWKSYNPNKTYETIQISLEYKFQKYEISEKLKTVSRSLISMFNNPTENITEMEKEDTEDEQDEQY